MTRAATALASAAARLTRELPGLSSPVVAYVLPTGRTLIASEPTRAASLAAAVDAVVSFFGSDWGTGEVAVTNDPYMGGTQVAEFTLVRGTNNGAVAIRARVPDIGGFCFGGYAPDSFDVWGEGARFTPLKIASAGKPRRQALDLIALNSRTPRLLLRALAEMERAADTVSAELDPRPPDLALLEQTREAARASVGGLRRSTYRAEALVMPPFGWDPAVVRLKLMVGDGSLVFDFSNSDRQVERPLNSTSAHTADCTLGAIAKALPGFPVAGGSLDVVTVDAGYARITGAALPATTGLSVFYTARAIRQVVGEALMAAGAPELDTDNWWQQHGERTLRAHINLKTLRLTTDRVDEFVRLEAKLAESN